MEDEAPQAVEANVPSYREILRFYWPLAVSWLLMAVELPIGATIVSRSADAEVQTAALLMAMGISLWIESPVIDLLATATTLTKTARDFALISRFTWYLMGLSGAVHALVALTPLYDLVTLSILRIPEPVAEAARIPMAILIPWSPFIGWRRYLQGVLIRHGRTKLIGRGTWVRVLTMGGVCFGLFFTLDLSGMTIAAIGLVSSVCAEAMFIYWASRETVHQKFRIVDPDGGEVSALTMGKLVRFHFPLTATTMTYMLSLPLTGAAIAQAPDGVSGMAAWQVATSLAFLHRCVVVALPEPIIALANGPATARRLARFCIGVGLIASFSIPAFVLLGVDKTLFGSVLGAPAQVVGMASIAYLATGLVPFLGAIQAYLRGMLTARHFTTARLGAVLASTAVLLGILKMGVEVRWPGVWVAALALTGSSFAELLALAWGWKRARLRPV
jgi:hypothetical protein